MQIGEQSALTMARMRMAPDMFKITQNTVRRFSLGEILLMAAMNEIEAQRRASAATRRPEGTS
jgi:hypothetical protein